MRIKQGNELLFRVNRRQRRSLVSMMPLTLLAACGGGGSSTPSPTPPAPIPPQEPDFTESPTGTFTAKDNSNGLTLSQGAATGDLIVVGKDGNDIITTGSGNDDIIGAGGNDTINAGTGADLIRGGLGADTITAGDGDDLIWGGRDADSIDAGEGNDIIVVIGTTAADAYESDSITAPAGQDIDLSNLIDLSDVNGNDISDLVTGETIDGGAGNNTLVIYGTVDLTGITLTNISQLWVNSTVTITPEQLSDFSLIVGDGTSDLIVSSGSVDTELDLTNITIENLDTITVDGNATIVFDSVTEVISDSTIRVNGAVDLEFTATSGSLDLDDLEIDGTIRSITINPDVTLDLSDISIADILTIPTVIGSGTVVLPDAVLLGLDILAGLFFDKDLTFVTGSGISIDVTDFGAIKSTELEVGESLTAALDERNEQDWYAVTLEAGEVYQIDLLGEASGAGSLSDPRIFYIADSEGNFIANTYNDDGADTRDSSLLFQPTESGRYYVIASSYLGNSTGTYNIAVDNVSDSYSSETLPIGSTNRNTFAAADTNVQSSGDVFIDSVLSGSRFAADPNGETTTVTWSFMSAGNFSTRLGYSSDPSSDSGREPFTGFQEFNDAQKNAFLSIIAHVESLVDVDLLQVADVAGPAGSPGSAGNIRIGWTNVEEENAAAYAYLPSNSVLAGDIWFLSNNLDQDVENNSFTFTTMIHELGHALGLKHPFEESGNFGLIPEGFNSVEWTVMSYTESIQYPDAVFADLYPQTFMYFDILALIHMYGAVETNAGDTNYIFDGNERYYQTMWDTGGVDSISFTNMTKGVSLLLQGGAWSDVGTTITYFTNVDVTYTEDFTIFIPEETDIEIVNGTDFSDFVLGGAEDNIFYGESGDDTLFGGEGDDILIGGLDEDTLIGGTGTDLFIAALGDGDSHSEQGDMVLDFTIGEDKIGLFNIEYDTLLIESDGDDTLIKDASGNILFTLADVDSSSINENSFEVVASLDFV